MRLVLGEPVNHMRARPFQPAGLPNIGGLVKPCTQFDQGGHRLARLGGLAQSLDNRRIAGSAIQGLLDRHDIGVGGGLLQEPDHHIKGFIGVMQQHILLGDGGEHVAIMVLHPFGHTRGKRRPQQIGAGVQHQFGQIGNPDQPVHLDHFLLADGEFLHDQLFQRRRGPGRDFHPHHFAPAAAFQGGFKLADQILGLVLDLQIAIAQHPERAGAFDPVARKQPVQMQDQQFLQRQEPMAFTGQGHKAVNLMRHWQQGAERAFVRHTFQLQRQCKAFVRDERKRMGGVNRQRRQDREHLIEKEIRQKRRILGGHIIPAQQGNSGPGHFGLQPGKHRLLPGHQAAGIQINQHQLLGGGQSIQRRGHIARQRQFAQTGDADHVKFVQIGRGNRQKPQPFQQRHTRVLGLAQHPPVKPQPAEFAVHKPGGAGHVGG